MAQQDRIQQEVRASTLLWGCIGWARGLLFFSTLEALSSSGCAGHWIPLLGQGEGHCATGCHLRAGALAGRYHLPERDGFPALRRLLCRTLWCQSGWSSQSCTRSMLRMTISINRKSRWEPGRGAGRALGAGTGAGLLRICCLLALAPWRVGYWGLLWSLVLKCVDSGIKGL